MRYISTLLGSLCDDAGVGFRLAFCCVFPMIIMSAPSLLGTNPRHARDALTMTAAASTPWLAGACSDHRAEVHERRGGGGEDGLRGASGARAPRFPGGAVFGQHRRQARARRRRAEVQEASPGLRRREAVREQWRRFFVIEMQAVSLRVKPQVKEKIRIFLSKSFIILSFPFGPVALYNVHFFIYITNRGRSLPC
jgi:hypothetical protein